MSTIAIFLLALTTSQRLFRHKSPKEALLLLYRDDPCVVIGRNQNPWKEVNLQVAEKTGTPWIRRRSGGGTVYHVCVEVILFEVSLTASVNLGFGEHQLLPTPLAFRFRPE